MKWIATEDVETCEVTEFEAAEETEVLWLMDGYKVDTSNPEGFCLHDTEDGQHIVYDGVIYKGGFGYNLWVANKYLEM